MFFEYKYFPYVAMLQEELKGTAFDLNSPDGLASGEISEQRSKRIRFAWQVHSDFGLAVRGISTLQLASILRHLLERFLGFLPKVSIL